MIPPATGGARWRWTLCLAALLTAVQWYLLRPDRVAAAPPGAEWLPVTGAPLSAMVAFSATFVLFALIPAVLARLLLGRAAPGLGLGMGDRRRGLALVGVGIPIAIAAGWVASRSPQMAALYPLGAGLVPTTAAFAKHAAGYALYYIGFEYFFRGFLLLGLSDRLGAGGANLLQATLALMLHFGKPPLEMAITFPASLAFGWSVLVTRSIWYAVVIHWVAGVTLDWFLVFR